jgi:hypothetical protein
LAEGTYVLIINNDLNIVTKKIIKSN